MYKLAREVEKEKNEITIKFVIKFPEEMHIPMVVGNTDYANFKKEINEDKAELQDADGNTMTAAEAKAFVAALP